MPTASNALHQLEQRGMVERIRDTEDRRGVRVTLTPLGKKELERVGDERTKHLADMLSSLPPEHLEIAADIPLSNTPGLQPLRPNQSRLKGNVCHWGFILFATILARRQSHAFCWQKCYQAESDMRFPLLWLNVSALKPRHYQYFCSPSKWLWTHIFVPSDWIDHQIRTIQLVPVEKLVLVGKYQMCLGTRFFSASVTAPLGSGIACSTVRRRWGKIYPWPIVTPRTLTCYHAWIHMRSLIRCFALSATALPPTMRFPMLWPSQP